MPPLRRSTRRRKLKVSSKAAELERATTRVNKRRETLSADQLTLGTFTKLLSTLPSTFAGLVSDDPVMQLCSTSNLFKLLAVEAQEPPIDQVVSLGAVPYLIEFLKLDDYENLQVEAARVLKNIAAGSTENTKVMVDCGAVPLLVKLTESSSEQVKEQALCALGNIAADSPGFCVLILTCGALHPLLSQLNERNTLSLLRTGTWTLANLCTETPEAQMKQFEPAISVLTSLLSTKDEAVLAEACWALTYLFRGGLTQDLIIFSTTTCPKLMELLMHPLPSVVYPAIRVFTSISVNDDLSQCAFIGRADLVLANLCAAPFTDCISNIALWTHGLIMDRVTSLPFETLENMKNMLQCSSSVPK